MNRHPELIPGYKHHHLLLVECKRGKRGPLWLCKCDCGNQTWMYAGNLRKNVSCGCVRSARNHSGFRRTHGMRRSIEYRIWSGIIARCENPNADSYKYYGGQGIRICEEWRCSFPAFYRAMGPRPSQLHTIERLDSHGNYEPGNCVWATYKEQNHNRRISRYIHVFGNRIHLSDAVIAWGRNYRKTYNRIYGLGWSPERALLTE